MGHVACAREVRHAYKIVVKKSVRNRIHISALIPPILTEGFRGFHQFFKANVCIEP